LHTLKVKHYFEHQQFETLSLQQQILKGLPHFLMATTHQQSTFFTNNRILAHLNIGYENKITEMGTTKFPGLQTCSDFNLNIHNEYAKAFYK
jgi:ABC-type Fe2+-enterobactin transport system substrate-binding protein